MPLDVTLRWLALGLLLVLNIFFAISETSLFALKPLDRLRLKQRRPRRAGIIEDLLGRSHRLLITTILGVEFVNILASMVATSLALSLWGPGANGWPWASSPRPSSWWGNSSPSPWP